MAFNMKTQVLELLLVFIILPSLNFAASIAEDISFVSKPCPIIHSQCTCLEKMFYTVNCKNISDISIINEITGNFTGETVELELEEVSFDSIPVQSLENQFLRTVIIRKSSFETLFNVTQLEETHNGSYIHHISLENVTLSEPWTWKQLSHLNQLDIFFSYNTSIGENINSSFSQYVTKSLKFLSIAESNISVIEDESFNNFTELTYLRVSHSKLRTLSRNVLSTPSKLVQLRLDHNLIASLPDDIFQNMPNLTVVSLSNNRISTLSQELFHPLWKSNIFLELRNNPIKCDCHMLWAVTSENKPNIIGECAHPKRLFRRDIKSLTESDFDC